MQDDQSTIQHSNDCKSPHLTAANILQHQWTCQYVLWRFCFKPTCPSLRCFALACGEKHGGHASCFTHILTVTFWLAETVGWLAVQSPLPTSADSIVCRREAQDDTHLKLGSVGEVLGHRSLEMNKKSELLSYPGFAQTHTSICSTWGTNTSTYKKEICLKASTDIPPTTRSCGYRVVLKKAAPVITPTQQTVWFKYQEENHPPK